MSAGGGKVFRSSDIGKSAKKSIRSSDIGKSAKKSTRPVDPEKTPKKTIRSSDIGRPAGTTDIGPIFTIGHSTRTLGDLIELLNQNGITLLVDVRTVPRSRTNPQFNTDALAVDLPKAGIEYLHMPDLGGLRHARSDSPNTVWENASFRGYADYMETDKFRAAVDRLVKLAKKRRLAVMCAEAVWWRCHRSMISDELVARGITVEHIGAGKRPQPHSLRSFAHVEDNHVSYR